ncbi:MAG TPA: ParB N-terminal domain-containing protein [bacterium]|nr:ParB N-terminal domain-containing protein [bacterium]HQJ59496.1 ParB N-terminal domain-containing protein [bacterium]
MATPKTNEKKLMKISIEKLEAMNYRDVAGDIDDIRDSLLEKGQLEPITVTPKIEEGKGTDRFIIVNGERRFRAAKNIVESGRETKFNFSELDCIIDTSYNLDTDSENFKLNQLILNEVHKSTTFDTYLAVKSLVDSKKYSKSQISKALGKDETWAGKIAALIIDNELFKCYFSGADLIYNKNNAETFVSLNSFADSKKDLMTEKEKGRVAAFLKSKTVELAEWEKDNGPLFETAELKPYIIYKGFGADSSPSIWAAQSLVEFYNDYCIDHPKKTEAKLLFSRSIRALMLKKRKTKADIDKIMEAAKAKLTDNGELEKEQKINIVAPIDMAKRIYNLFKDIELNDEQVREIKKHLRAIVKDPKYKERIFVDISLTTKKKDEDEESPQ